NQQDWISMQHIQNLFSKVAQGPEAKQSLLASLELSKAQLSNSELTLPIEKLEPLLEQWRKAFPDKPLGLMLASNSQPVNFGVIGYLSQSCLTFSDALNILTQYNGILSNIGEINVSFSPGCVHINWHCTRDNNSLFYR